MIERGEFAIQETQTRREIDLTQDWETCFLPEQVVDMSMIFRKAVVRTIECPGCKTTCEGQSDADVKCAACGMTFCRVVSIDQDVTEPIEPSPDSNNARRTRAKPPPSSRSVSVWLSVQIFKRKREDEQDDEMRLFRRVRLIDNRVKGPIWRLNVYCFSEKKWNDLGTGVWRSSSSVSLPLIEILDD